MKLEVVIKSEKFKSEVHKAGLNILYTAWWLKTEISRELKEFGLTHEQYNVLRILRGKHPQQMCVRDIASRMIEKNSNVPRIIDRLELKKWVDRSTSLEDKRETVIKLTVEGTKVLEQATVRLDNLYNKSITVDDREAALLNNLLERVRANEK
ncbi:MarR family winged helix-turn-helix transcriptional regulator [Chitinophagaceae bacterium LWZ2-11]